MQGFAHASNIPKEALSFHFWLTLGLVEIESDG